jgi:hypothetical protein
MTRRASWLAAAVLVAVGVLVFASLPQARLELVDGAGDSTVAGILHIHTNRSDGRSAPQEVAVAAARAGLKFIVFTDHGDATRAPEPPAYRAGVLCVDGVEISTTAGHYVALGLPATAYPLGGEPRDVVEDVRRLGGFGIAAHPDSPKRELQWGRWEPAIDGIELINPDTSWRTQLSEPGLRSKMRLLGALTSYPFRGGETIAGLIGDRSGILGRWDQLTASRRVVGIAGVDAHAKLALRDVEPGDNSFTMPFPAYETVFRVLSVHVQPARPFTGQAAADAEALIEGLRAGHLYTAVDAVASPPSFEFSATTRDRMVQQGDEVQAGEPLTLRVRTNAPQGFTTTIVRDGRAWSPGHHESDFAQVAPQMAGVYRVEIHASNRQGDPVWIIGNPIYVRDSLGDRGTDLASARVSAAKSDPLFPAATSVWSVEHDPDSRADLVAGPDHMTFRWTLGGELLKRPSAAMVAAPLQVSSSDRLTFTMRADRPMRLSVQLRTGPSGLPEERWQRSVYIDEMERENTVFFEDFTPLGPVRTERPALAAVSAVLFVVETTNTKAGASGTVSIGRVALQAADVPGSTPRAGKK